MTVSTAYAPLLYNGNGATTEFAVTWPFLTGTLVVTAITSGGAESTEVLTTDYTVEGGTDANGLPAIGTVTMNEAPASGTQLRITRVTTLTQASTWSESANFPQKTIEAAIDKLTLLAQERAYAALTRAMQLDTSGEDDFWDADGNLISDVSDPESAQDAATKAYVDGLAFGTSVSAFVMTLLDDATAAAFMTTLGISANAQTLLGQTFAQIRASLDLEAGTDFLPPAAIAAAYQPLDADLTAWAGVNPSSYSTTAQIAAAYQPLDSDLTAIAALTTTAYGRALLELASAAALTAAVNAFVGDSGSGGTKGLVPAPVGGDATKFLRGDGTFQTIAGGGDLLAANNLSDVASAATAFGNIKQAASETATGVVELATDAETQTGTDTARAITPANLTAAAIKQGKHTVFMPALAMTRRATNGAAAGATELATNDVMLSTFDFDQTTEEGAGFWLWMPKSYNGSTVTFRPIWTAASGTGGVVWSLAGRAFPDDAAMDAAPGTAQTSTDTFIVANDMHVGPESAAITIAGSPAAEVPCYFEVRRVTGNGSDTLTADAKLIGIHVYMTLNAATDA